MGLQSTWDWQWRRVDAHFRVEGASHPGKKSLPTQCEPTRRIKNHWEWEKKKFGILLRLDGMPLEVCSRTSDGRERGKKKKTHAEGGSETKLELSLWETNDSHWKRECGIIPVQLGNFPSNSFDVCVCPAILLGQWRTISTFEFSSTLEIVKQKLDSSTIQSQQQTAKIKE